MERVKYSKINKRLSPIWDIITQNAGYKLVAFLVTLVLWISILGREDSVVSRDMELELLLSPSYVITNKVNRTVRVRVSGPRMALKKFNQMNELIIVDLKGFSPGLRQVKIDKEQVALPLGVKVLSITPNFIKARIEAAKEN